MFEGPFPFFLGRDCRRRGAAVTPSGGPIEWPEGGAIEWPEGGDIEWPSVAPMSLEEKQIRRKAGRRPKEDDRC